ncbi:MAG TPA: hypothetical protein VNT22_09755 [Baekduia sp.]|nr:hypothetical protein [Baekduia sp.]
MLAAIEWSHLLELVWAAALAGIAVAIIYALMILGISKADDARRRGAAVAAGLYGVLALAATVAFVGAIVYGVSIITTK